MTLRYHDSMTTFAVCMYRQYITWNVEWRPSSITHIVVLVSGFYVHGWLHPISEHVSRTNSSQHA